MLWLAGETGQQMPTHWVRPSPTATGMHFPHQLVSCPAVSYNTNRRVSHRIAMSCVFDSSKRNFIV